MLSMKHTQKMTYTQVVETSVTANNSPSQEYTSPNDQQTTKTIQSYRHVSIVYARLILSTLMFNLCQTVLMLGTAKRLRVSASLLALFLKICTIKFLHSLKCKTYF